MKLFRDSSHLYRLSLILIFLVLLLLGADRLSTNPELEITGAASSFKNAITYARANLKSPFIYDLVAVFKFLKIENIWAFRFPQILIGIWQIFIFLAVLKELKMRDVALWSFIPLTSLFFIFSSGEVSIYIWLAGAALALIFYGFRMFNREEASFLDVFLVSLVFLFTPTISFSGYIPLISFDLAILSLLLVKRDFSKIIPFLLLQVLGFVHFFGWSDVETNFFRGKSLKVIANPEVFKYLGNISGLDDLLLRLLLLVIGLLIFIKLVRKEVTNFYYSIFIFILTAASFFISLFYQPLGFDLRQIHALLFWPAIIILAVCLSKTDFRLARTAVLLLILNNLINFIFYLLAINRVAVLSLVAVIYLIYQLARGGASPS